MSSETEIEFRILGRVEAIVGGEQVPLRAAKLRALLAYLLVNAGKVVPSDRLVDELWGDEPPSSVSASLQVHVSRLRKLLGDDARDLIETTPRGYVLHGERARIDAGEFEALVADARALRASGEDERALASLRDALGLWRGSALADVTDGLFAAQERERLEQLRLTALEERLDAELAVAADGRAVAELERLVREHPRRERLAGLLMRALYRSGRQTDALDVFRSTRDRLVHELGVEPGPELRALQAKILRHDPSLDGPAAPARAAASPAGRRRRPGRRALLGAAAVAAAAGAIVGVLASRSGDAPVAVRSNSVAVIDARSNRLIADVGVGRDPGAISFGDSAVWAASVTAQTVTRIDVRTRRSTDTIGLAGPPNGVAATDGEVWAATGFPPAAAAIDPETGTVVHTVPIPPKTTSLSNRDRGPAAIAADLLDVWVGHGPGGVTRVDPVEGHVVKTVTLPSAGYVTSLALDAGTVWVGAADGTVSWIDRRTGSAGTINLTPDTGRTFGGGAVAGVASTGETVWATLPETGLVVRIDPGAHAVVRTIQAGRRRSGSRPRATRSGSRTAATGRSAGSTRQRTRSSRRSGSAAGLRRSPWGPATCG